MRATFVTAIAVGLFSLLGAARPVSAGQWVDVGPPGAGIASIAIDPATPSHIYAAAPLAASIDTGGGVFVTTDAGLTWSLPTTLSSVQYVTLEAAHPSHVWALTFDGKLHRSTDGAATWSIASVGAGYDYYYQVAADPLTAGTVYVAANGDILKSTDDGATWNVVYTRAFSGAETFGLAASPVTADVVYASVRDVFGFAAVLRSSDGGANWTVVTPPDPPVLSFFGFDPADASTVYGAGYRAASPMDSTPIATVYKTTDDGVTWNEVRPSSNHPVTHFTVDQLDGTLYAVTSDGVFRSDTGGASYTTLPGTSGGATRTVAVDPAASSKLWAGTGRGPFLSSDTGATWGLRNAGMNQLWVEAIAADPLHVGEMLVHLSNGQFMRTTDHGATWAVAGSGTPTGSTATVFAQALVYDPSASGRVYAGVVGTGQGVYKSADGGQTFSPSTAFFAAYSIAIDPFDANHVVAGSYRPATGCEAAVDETFNQGTTWFENFVDDAGACQIDTIAFDPTTEGTAYVGGASFSGGSGDFYKTTDGMATWFKSFIATDVYQLVLDPVNANAMYGLMNESGAPSANRIYKFALTQSGFTFTQMMSGVTAPVTALGVDPDDFSTLYTASKYGAVYRSTNGASSWSALGTFPANVFVTALITDPFDTSRVYAATRNHGILAYVPVCGDGVAEGDEECDDGNLANGDCCSATCTAINDGQSCDDGEGCTTADQCSAGACVGGAPLVCPLCQVCGPLGSCVGAPRNDCKQSTGNGKSKLTIKDSSDAAKDQVSYKFGAGQGTLASEIGDPSVGTGPDYALCIFEGMGNTPLFTSTVPAGGLCAGKPCWKAAGSGYKYSEKTGAADGAKKVGVSAGGFGKTKASYKGGGAGLGMSPLGMPAPDLTTPVRVQLQAEGGTCFEATFSNPSTNETGSFKAKSD